MTNYRTRNPAAPIHIAQAFLLLGVLLAAAGCSGLAWLDPPPIEWEAAWIVEDDRGALHESRGLYLSMANASAIEIEVIEVAADLFDADGRAPGEGSTRVFCTADVWLRPGESCTLVVSLDDVSEEFRPARIRVERARFANGGEWRNPGTHFYDGEIL